MGWDGPMLTDSGGFHFQSWARYLRRMKSNRPARENKRRCWRNSRRKGPPSVASRWVPTYPVARSSVEIQRKLGADLIVVPDECTPYHVDRKYTADRWR